MSSRYLIGVDPDPTTPGSYNIEVEGIMSCFAIFAEFDGEKWDIPSCYLEGFPGDTSHRKVWWYG